jgi:hypothetical protein
MTARQKRPSGDGQGSPDGAVNRLASPKIKLLRRGAPQRLIGPEHSIINRAANSLRRRHLGVNVSRHDYRDQRGWNLVGPERSGNRVLDRQETLQIGDDRLGIL